MSALVALWILHAAVAAPADPMPSSAPSGRWLDPVTVTGSIDGEVASGELRVYVPRGYDERAAAPDSPRFPLVIALHGWDHSPALFADKGTLAPLADRYGFVVAIPDTGRSVFETRFYKKTRGAPGARWVGEVILPYLRKSFHVATDKRRTGIIGYSTGGRGATLVAELYPEFAFVGSVSGTYDLMALDPRSGEYRIHAMVYGPRAKHPDRWRRDSGVERVASLAGVDLYVAHGEKDAVVPVGQVSLFEQALSKVPLASSVFIVTPGAGHDWALWNTHWPAMFEAMHRLFGAPP